MLEAGSSAEGTLEDMGTPPGTPPVLRLRTFDLTTVLSKYGGAATSECGAHSQCLCDESQREIVRLALTSHGALQLQLPERHRSILSAAHDASRFLFRQPANVKRQLRAISPGGFTRGYIPIGGEAAYAGVRELKEGFSFGYEWKDEEEEEESGRRLSHPAGTHNPLQGPNAWPDSLPEWKTFRSRAMEAYDVLCEISRALVAVVGEVFFNEQMGGKEDFVKRFGSEEGDTISVARMFRYFQDDSEEDGTKRIGSGEHTDWGFLTLVSEDVSFSGPRFREGLQILAASSPFAEPQWHSVNPDPGCLVLHSGDYLSLLSGGIIRSPVHRVVPPSAAATTGTGPSERFSIAFFWYPAYHATFPPVAKPAGRKLSLLEDQRESSASSTSTSIRSDQEEADRRMVERLRTTSFGEIICDKWAQVFRNR